jgi:hypothetical protein
METTERNTASMAATTSAAQQHTLDEVWNLRDLHEECPVVQPGAFSQPDGHARRSSLIDTI